MNKFKYKERDYAKEILNNGFTSKHILTELKILAKYYKELGYKEDELKDLICNFCKENLNGYNHAIHFRVINSAINHANDDKNKLMQIDKIDITKSELEYIDKLDITHEQKRVIFTLLVMTKLSKEYTRLKDHEIKSNEFYFGKHNKYRELVSTSKISFDKRKKSLIKNIHDLIRLFHEKGIVEIRVNGNIKLLFMYDIEECENVEIVVDDYGVIGFYYDLYYEENRVKKCEECGRLIKAYNTQKYCNECSLEKKKESKRENWHKNKEKYNTR